MTDADERGGDGGREGRVRLPAPVAEYLQRQGVDLAVYEVADLLPRHVRVRPGRDVDAIAQEMAAELGATVTRVPYAPAFLELPSTTSHIMHTMASQRGDIVGMDVSSGVCVAALEATPDHHVLDLCAAPGAKLAMIADLLDERGSITAVDPSATRMAACHTLLGRLRLIRQTVPRVRLIITDGRTLAWQAPVGSPWDPLHPKRPFPRTNFAHCHVDLAVLAPQTGVLYDRVLVDAPCTHDGSMRHMVKSFGGGRGDTDDAVKTFLQGHDADELRALQSGLLRRGFELLKPGGRLVYSTCSLTVAQNEDIVKTLLNDFPTEARLVPLPDGVAPASALMSSILPPAVRMHPLHTNTSALFITLIVKQASTAGDE